MHSLLIRYHGSSSSVLRALPAIVRCEDRKLGIEISCIGVFAAGQGVLQILGFKTGLGSGVLVTGCPEVKKPAPDNPNRCIDRTLRSLGFFDCTPLSALADVKVEDQAV